MESEYQDQPTRGSLDEDESDSVAFMLAEDFPPKFVEAATRYEILGEVGRGGVGIIYKARDCHLDRMVAIKVLRHEFRNRDDIIQRFEQEARIISQLPHPGLAPVFECGTCDDGRPFHSMKLVDGNNLKNVIQDETFGSETQSHAVSAFANVCQTIAYAHSRNIVHLDIKPANIMIGTYGEVHVMDWGSARQLDRHGKYASVSILRTNARPPDDQLRVVGGTLEYLAPEQAAGGSLDKRTDVFALGACLCHILTGKPPYGGEGKLQIYRSAVAGDIMSAHRGLINCNADPALIRLAINCLQPDPDDRPDDAREVAGAISTYQNTAFARFQSDMTRFFELSHDLFCIAALDGYFRRINSNFSRLLGHSDADLMSRPFLEFVHPDDHQKTMDVMGQLVEGRPIVRFQNRYRTAAGDYVVMEWTAKSIPEEGLIFAVARDVTDVGVDRILKQDKGSRKT